MINGQAFYDDRTMGDHYPYRYLDVDGIRIYGIYNITANQEISVSMEEPEYGVTITPAAAEVGAGKTVTLDLNGNTISQEKACTGHYAMIVNKAVSMANMMNIPIIGVVENMSYVKCPDCGKKIEVFGKSKLDGVAQKFNLPILARLPIDPKVAECYDAGKMESVDVSRVADVLPALEKA